MVRGQPGNLSAGFTRMKPDSVLFHPELVYLGRLLVSRVHVLPTMVSEHEPVRELIIKILDGVRDRVSGGHRTNILDRSQSTVNGPILVPLALVERVASTGSVVDNFQDGVDSVRHDSPTGIIVDPFRGRELSDLGYVKL